MKLSKHPVGTFIHVEGLGHYEKVDKGLWRHASGKANFLTKKYIRNIEKTDPKRIKIIAAPWSVVVEMMTMLMEEYGHTDSEGKAITFDSIYKDAVLRDEEFQRHREEERRQAEIKYCAEDVAATERLMNRVLPKSVIYKVQKLDMSSKPSMFEEEWRKIPGFNWSASNQGRVRNDNISQHITRPYVVNGCLFVELTDSEGRYVERLLSNIMLETFPEESKGR